jgi:ABC-type lipoprotein export system ATPase subunit
LRYECIIETKDLARHYSLGGSTIKALDGIDMKVKHLEYLSIVGPSGSGKTTLFNMIGGLDRPIIDLLKKLIERGVTIIAATHDRKMIDMSDRIIWIRDGKIEREGKPADIE